MKDRLIKSKTLILIFILFFLSIVASKAGGVTGNQVGGYQVGGGFKPADSEETRPPSPKTPKDKSEEKKSKEELKRANDLFSGTPVSGQGWFANHREVEIFEECFQKEMDSLRGQPLEILKEAFIKYEKGKLTGKFWGWLLGKNVGWAANQIYKELLLLTNDRKDIVPESWQNVVNSYTEIIKGCGVQVTGKRVNGSGQVTGEKVNGKQVHGSLDEGFE